MATQMENITPQFGFEIRGERFLFDTREDYLEAFGRALDIAAEQDRIIEGEVNLEEETTKYTNC